MKLIFRTRLFRKEPSLDIPIRSPQGTPSSLARYAYMLTAAVAASSSSSSSNSEKRDYRINRNGETGILPIDLYFFNNKIVITEEKYRFLYIRDPPSSAQLGNIVGNLKIKFQFN
jgi:hypothetical protein